MNISKKGIWAIILFVVLFLAIVIFTKVFIKDPLIKALMWPIILALLAVGAIIFKPFREWLGDFIDININRSGHKLRIFIVGLGRSGKTSIIRHILTGDAPRQEKSTETFFICEKKQSLDLKNPFEITVSIVDYKGQKQSQVTTDSYQYPEFFGKPGARLINVLVFVVDLFPELKNKRGKVLDDSQLIKRYKQNAKERIEERVKEHKEYISQFFIEQLFSLTSAKNLFSVQLLVNKVDLLREVAACGYLPEVTEKNMKMCAKGLFKKISGDISGACQANNIDDLSIHLVSAKKGDNLKLIFGDIFETFHKWR